MRTTLSRLWAAAVVAASLAGCTGEGGYLPDFTDDPAAPAAGGATQYTVLLKVFRGPGHNRIANDQYAKRLTSQLGWRGLFVVSEDDHSELYWGVFDSPKNARGRLKKARAHRTRNGLTPFRAAIITVVPGSDRGNPEWDIQRCPGHYSLLVAVFEDQPEASPPYVGRRDFAAEYCRQLRQQGHEAYYHHGPRSSSVTIGSFGPGAVETRKKRLTPPGGGRPVLSEVSTPVGPRLLALMEKFPHRAYNGRKFFNVRKDARGNIISRKPAPSIAIRVPGKDTTKGVSPRANHRPGHWQPR